MEPGWLLIHEGSVEMRKIIAGLKQRIIETDGARLVVDS